MTKAEAVKKAEAAFANAQRQAQEMENPAGYSACYFSCELGRRKLNTANALPNDWEGDYDALMAPVRNTYINENVQRECRRLGLSPGEYP